MANIGAYAAKQFLDWNLGGAAATQPASRFVGLTTGNPTSLNMSEFTSGDGYIRQSLSCGAAASPAGSASNAVAMTFGSPTFVSSRVVSGLIITDSVSIAGGNLWWYGTPLVVRTPLSGDTVVIAVGGLVLTLA
jgi:hypothetical protein